MTWGCEWCHALEACAEYFGGFVKSELVESCRPKKKGDFHLLAKALWQMPHVVWGRWKSQVYLSPYAEKPFNSKVIKSFVPELRSRKCFLCFEISMLYIYVHYGHEERFAYWYEYAYFTYSYLAM